MPHTPPIRRDRLVTALGSCFADEIRIWLRDRGFRVNDDFRAGSSYPHVEDSTVPLWLGSGLGAATVCYAHAMHIPCTCCAHAVHMLCTCYARAMSHAACACACACTCACACACAYMHACACACPVEHSSGARPSPSKLHPHATSPTPPAPRHQPHATSLTDPCPCPCASSLYGSTLRPTRCRCCSAAQGWSTPSCCCSSSAGPSRDGASPTTSGWGPANPRP